MHSGVARTPSPDVDEVINGFRKLDESRHARIRPLYEKYQEGGSYAYHEYIPEDIQLVPSSDFHVSVRWYIDANTIEDVDVVRISEPCSINIMGYVPRLRCYAFRGEVALLEQFLAFIEEVFTCYRFAITFRSHQVRIPLFGLPRGLSYDKFAAYAEIVDYIVWLQDKDENAVDEDASADATQMDQEEDQEEAMVGSPAAVNDMETDGVEAAPAVEERLGKPAEAAAAKVGNQPSTLTDSAYDEPDFFVGRYALRARAKPSNADNPPTPAPKQSAKGPKKTPAKKAKSPQEGRRAASR